MEREACMRNKRGIFKGSLRSIITCELITYENEQVAS